MVSAVRAISVLAMVSMFLVSLREKRKSERLSGANDPPVDPGQGSLEPRSIEAHRDAARRSFLSGELERCARDLMSFATRLDATAGEAEGEAKAALHATSREIVELAPLVASGDATWTQIAGAFRRGALAAARGHAVSARRWSDAAETSACGRDLELAASTLALFVEWSPEVPSEPIGRELAEMRRLGLRLERGAEFDASSVTDALRRLLSAIDAHSGSRVVTTSRSPPSTTSPVQP